MGAAVAARCGVRRCVVARGGARNRSGPQPDPRSARSDGRGLSFTALPASGFGGPVPEWPLSRRVVLREEWTDGAKAPAPDEDATCEVAARELEVWAWAWGTPQAWAWAQPSESWRLLTIAMWVRTYVICESSEATAADKSSLHRFADQIGLTPAGLRENGWLVARDEVGEARASVVRSESAPDRPVRRLRAAP